MADEHNTLHSAANGIGYTRRLSYGDIVHIDGLPYKYVGDSFVWTQTHPLEIHANEVGEGTSPDKAAQEHEAKSVQHPAALQRDRIPQWLFDKVGAEREYERATVAFKQAQIALNVASEHIQQARQNELIWRDEQTKIAREAVIAAELLNKA